MGLGWVGSMGFGGVGGFGVGLLEDTFARNGNFLECRIFFWASPRGHLHWIFLSRSPSRLLKLPAESLLASSAGG